MAHRMGYRDSLRWLLDNDDCHWLDEEDGINSVTSSLVADIFGKTDEEVKAALMRMREKRND